MGGKPGVLQQERLSWARDHSLQVSPELRSRFLPGLKHFPIGSGAELWTRTCQCCGIQYQHYFIANAKRTWTIEFGAGQGLDNKVEVHNLQNLDNALLEKTFTVTAEHVRRMQQVVGSLNYSLCLRNCEHVARYIDCGSWVSMQMLCGGILSKAFRDHMMGESRKLINQIPNELREHHEPRPLYPGADGLIQLTQAHKQGLTIADEDAFDIVFIGPTGSGKSSLINRFFNKSICKEGGTASSVTREISIYEGNGFIKEKIGSRMSKINVIDTIGFCDSAMRPEEVVALVKDWLKVQHTTIDRFIIVVSGRIEATHVKSIKDMMSWLEFGRHRMNFTFVYNKADLIQDEALLQGNIATMAEMLGTGFGQMMYFEDDTDVKMNYNLNISLGITPNANASESAREMSKLKKITMVRTYDRSSRQSRVPVDTSGCTIL